ncbi:fibronectin type III domain-containing protein 1 isoform X1 [Gadus macrocephalus]|uniref:fibronectin type III domain-containing protein 1 isoform X1 n=1 Tax=Gadus macrocephalus TaxID=80720 RepID=UPI0028CBA720|nr:fibronectin type III domain-containing protein 1 isoform X1 [Gadus macrocephalus]
MAFAATRRLWVLFVFFCAIGPGLAAERPAARTQGSRAEPAEQSAPRRSWEPTAQLDGSPVDRYSVSATKPIRAQHRLAKAGRDKDARVPLPEDVDPEWANLDGFAVVGGGPVNASSAAGRAAGPLHPAAPARVEAPVEVPVPVEPASPVSRAHRRPPQSSSGPRQPYSRALGRLPLVDRRQQHSTKPQSDQRNRNGHKLASESVHVVSLQAQRTPGRRSNPVSRPVLAKASVPEPEEEAKDITVRVMSPQSVLISWVDSLVELQKINANELRYYTVKYREKGESARWEFKESTQRRLLIDGLSADGMYEFSVRITQGEKHGKWSVSVFQRTPESAPSGPPENFEVKPLRGKGTAVTATWDPPEEPNGRIREYILSYAPAMKPFGMKSVTYGSSTSSATVDGLTPGDRYIFKIKATNRRGQGPLSKAFSVVMPGTLSSSKSQDSRRASPASSQTDRSHAESDVQSAEVTETPQTTRAQSTHRRVRPLSQSRSYHSIFSSVRGSARNGASSRGRAREKPEEKVEEEEEEEEAKTFPTKPPPEEEPVTVEAVEEEEADNDVVYSEPQVTSTLVVTPTPMTSTLRAVTLAPTTAATTPRKAPPRRPIKIRVHQKPGSPSLSSSSSSTALSSSSSGASSTLLIPKHSQELSVIQKDGYTDSLKPESKVPYAQPSLSQREPSTPVSTQTTAQPKTVAPPSGRDPAVARRISGSVLNSRYGFGQRNSGIAARGNFTRYPNGYKYRPDSTANAQAKLPGRTQSQASSNTDSSKSQSPLPTGSQTRETSGTLNSAVSRSNSRTGSQSKSTSNTEGLDVSRSRSHNPSSAGAHNPSLIPLSGSRTPAATETQDSRPAARRVTHNTATSHNTQPSHTPEKQDTTYGEESDNAERENTGSRTGQAEGQTSAVRLTALNANVPSAENDGKESEEGPDGEEEKDVVSPARVQPSHAERSPSLAGRFPGRFGTGARVSSNRQQGRAPWGRTSSSVGAGRPVLQGSARRASGATGAAGVSTIQETSDNVEAAPEHNLLKKGLRDSLHKPSTTVRKNEFSESRQPSTSTAAPSSSNSDSHHSSGGHRASSEAVHGGGSHNHNNNNNNDNDHEKDYLYEGSKVIVDRNEKVPDPTAAPKTTTSNPVNHHQTPGNRGGVEGDKREPSSGGRTSSSYQRPAVSANGRARSPSSAIRVPGGYRLPFRVQPAQSTRARSPTTSDSSSLSESSSHSSSSKMPRPVLTSVRGEGRGSSVTRTGGLPGGGLPSSAAASYTPPSSSSSASSRDSLRTRTRYPNFRGKAPKGEALRPNYGNDKNGRPNLSTSQDKESSTSELDSRARRRLITGPDGKKWVVDLDKGLLMNEEGKALQDSQGRPRRVVLGDDGRTIFDLEGSPLVNQEGLALFGQGRDGQPVVNPKDKVLTVGGKPVLGLDRPHHRTTTRAPTTTTTTTTRAPTTTTTTTTTTPATTTVRVPTTPEWFLEDGTTMQPYPTCPPGTFSKTDEYGYPALDPEGILDCYPEEESSGMESDNKLTDALALEQDEFLIPTTLRPRPATTTTSPPQEHPALPGHVNRKPSSALDLTGKKRFTAPYMNYIQKDPGAPCSLTEALEYLQVDILGQLMDKDTANHRQPPKNKPHNITVVAMEGCHSFVILDWARPLKDDMVSGYMVHSASYDDVLNNRWAALDSQGTHLAVENLKPNSRYYFKVQAKNVFGLGPVSETLTYVTESDDPLLIERPPGGEPIWIPFSFKYNHAHSGCKGSQYVKRTWYRKFVGVILCNSLRYKIFMGEGLREPFYSIADTSGQGEDHCQFVDSYFDGRTGPVYQSNALPAAQGFYRSHRQEPVRFGTIGRRTPHPFVGWYECGVPIPGKW